MDSANRGMTTEQPTIGLETLAERWDTVRTLLKAEGLGPLIVYGVGLLGQYGMVQYLTGTFPDLKGTYVVFGRGMPPVIVAGSPLERVRWEKYGDASVEVAFPTDGSRGAQLRLVADLVKNRRDGDSPAVAAGGGRGLPWSDYRVLVDLLAAPGLADASHIVSQAKSRKTAADLAGLRSAMAMAEDALDSFLARAGGGISERSAAASIESELRRRGAPTCLVDVSAGPYLSQAPTDRKLESGDLAKVFVEVASADGYWVELGAVAACGTVTRNVRTSAENCIETLKQAENLLMPGSRCSDVARAIDRRVRRFGYAAFGFGHGIGIDEEEPSISIYDHAELQAGMTIALHPSIMTDRGSDSVAVANSYLIGDQHPVPLSNRPAEIYQIA